MIEKDTDPRLELVTQIKMSFESDPMAFINQTQNLNQADVAMIGTVIQLYCYADFNARRIIDVLRHAATGKPRSVSRLQDAQVFPSLENLVREHLWDGHLKDGLLIAASTVEMHRLHRHNFAHWIARRVKGADALVMFSMNAREAERRDGIPQQPKEAKFGVLPLVGFNDEIRKLQGHTNYLARTAADLENNVDELQREIARRLSK
jgi:hypothetical protein